ncbi:MAG: NUDIX hydrolase [Chloroflexota bacterium]|nr:NUDIX hydrolase [Chloroflexota bacterium]
MPILRTARATSAGGVVFRASEGRVEVALAHRREPALWALPKGTPNAGESLEQTALRETREETGLEAEVVAPIDAIRYFFVRGSTRFHKTVHFFLMRATGGDVSDHDHEFDEVRWVQLEEAAALLSYPTERSVLDRATALIDALGTAATAASA